MLEHDEWWLPAKQAGAVLRRWRVPSDPLWLFLVAGALIFVLYAVFADEPPDPEALAQAPDPGSLATIEVSRQVLDSLREQFEWFEGRPPTADELRRRVDGWVADEVLFREALRSGLHRVDARIREQLVDHMRQLHAGDLEPPDDAVLLQFYLDNMDRYYGERKFTLQQVYFRDRPAVPDAVLAALRSGERVQGEELWLGRKLIGYDESMLRAELGGAFVNALLQREPDGAWFGPLESGRGFHFVRFDARVEPVPLAFARIRGQVLEDWRMSEFERRVAQFVAEKAPDYRIRRSAEGSVGSPG